MKKPMFTRVCANLLIGAGMFFAANAFADAKWSCTYREKDNTYILTSLTAGDGGTASVYNVKDGALTKSTAGTETVIDLREEAMPEGAPKILSIGYQMWMNNKVVQKIYLPNTVRILGSRLIESASNLVHIEPFVPESVTNIATDAFQWGSVTNDFRVGFAKDEKGNYIETELLGNVVKSTPGVKKVVLGPGIKKVPANFMGNASVASIEFGENIEVVEDTTIPNLKNTLTNVVFKTRGEFPFPGNMNLFGNCKSVQEVTWNGWCAHPDYMNPFSGWSALQCRFIIPGDNVKWAKFCADETKMTPWSACEEADKTAYYEKYGESAKEPVGISVANAASFPRTYIVKDERTMAGAAIEVGTVDAAFGTVTVSPAVPEGGYYTEGTLVTITFAAKDGVTFKGWTGDVAEADKMNASITLTASGAMSVAPTFESSYWVYENGELKDGTWTLKATGAADAISVGVVREGVKNGDLNLRKEVKGGVITAIADDAFKRLYSWATIQLPDTIQSIGGTAFQTWDNPTVKRTSISPMLPKSVTYVGSGAFYMGPALTGDLEVGFATNAAGESVETELNSGGQQFRYCVVLGPNVKIGPGVRSIPTQAFYETCKNYASPVEVWIGSGVTNAAARAFSYFHYAGKSKATTYHIECDMFPGSSAMFYNGSTAEINDYTARFMIEGEENRDWLKYVWNTDYVTRWADLTDDQKQQYWTNFPEDTFGTEHPMGLVKVAQDTTGLPPNQWVFAPRAGGLVIRVQ